MEKALSNLFLTIVEDGGKVTVGDKTFNVTLAEAVTNEIKPVEGKWYRRVKEGSYPEFTVGKWYQYGNYGFNSQGQSSGALRLFDLSNPLDFDPETLVGKEVKFEEWVRFWKIVGINEDHVKIESELGTFTYHLSKFNTMKYELRDPEPTLTVPENVEFVDWVGDIALSYNGFLLSQDNSINTFALTSTQDFIKALESPLQLVPCELSEAQNGDWVVPNQSIDKPYAYWLITEKGAVRFNDENYPIKIVQLNDGGLAKEGWLKVVQG